MYSRLGHAEAPTFGDGWLCVRCCKILGPGGGAVGCMHSKLQGLTKPNRLPMPGPAGECPRAISGEPQAGCVAWRGEKNSRDRSLQGIPGAPGLNGR